MEKRQVQALILEFSGLKNEEIASEVGVNKRTLQNWKNKPEWGELSALLSEQIVIESAVNLSAKTAPLIEKALRFLDDVLADETGEVGIRHKLQASAQILGLLKHQDYFKNREEVPKSAGRPGLSDDTMKKFKREVLGLDRE